MNTLHFQIQHEDWIAEIQLPAAQTLEDLAYATIDAVGFDMDHSFGFYDNLRNPYRSNEEYTLFADMEADAEEDNPGVRTTRMDSVFRPKKRMLFLFDYGDDWMFLVTCTGESDERPFKKPKLIGASGTPPEQYPECED